MLSWEKKSWEEGHRRIAGVDEVGRGPLAGPVVAAAVTLADDFLLSEEKGILDGLTDSKKLSEKRRDYFFDILTNSPSVQYGIGVVSVEEIDQLNILRATHRAMALALQALQPPAGFALIDGRPVPGLPCPNRAIIHGDSLSLSIAAASVLAKVTRDKLMVVMDVEYPAYGFAQHKGYGTAGHLEALKRHGPCPQHRRSFRPVHECAQLRLTME